MVFTARAAGIIILIILAVIFRGEKEGNIRFAPQWWGILGLIGWAYLASALITIFSKNNFYIIVGSWLFFCILSMVSKAGYIPHNTITYYIPDAIRGGTLAGLTMGGVLTSLIFQYYRKRGNNKGLTTVFLAFSALLIVLSVCTRPYWRLAKLGATPAWLFLCSAFTILAFTTVYWLADVKGKTRWFSVVKPAGTDTLLCYLVPYFIYTITAVPGLYFPYAMLSGGLGILKSLLFAVFCVIITGWLNRGGVKLKL